MQTMKKCKAISKCSKQRCKNYAIQGMRVCRMHGGILGNSKSRKARRQAVLKHGKFTQEAICKRKKMLNFIKESRDYLETI